MNPIPVDVVGKQHLPCCKHGAGVPSKENLVRGEGAQRSCGQMHGYTDKVKCSFSMSLAKSPYPQFPHLLLRMFNGQTPLLYLTLPSSVLNESPWAQRDASFRKGSVGRLSPRDILVVLVVPLAVLPSPVVSALEMWGGRGPCCGSHRGRSQLGLSRGCRGGGRMELNQEASLEEKARLGWGEGSFPGRGTAG